MKDWSRISRSPESSGPSQGTSGPPLGNRVIEKGGNIAVLEFAEPRNKIMKPLYSIYLNHILPAIGGMVSKKRSAYKYLALSIEKFPKYGDFCSELSAAGFKEVKYRALTGGVALLYTGKKS